MAVMDAEVAAPVQSASFQTNRCTLPEYVSHKFQRSGISLRLPDRRDNSTPAGGHGEGRDRPELAGAQL